MNAPTPLSVLNQAVFQSQSAQGAQGKELPHESAHLHVSGEAIYTDDIAELRGTLHAALVLSNVAHGKLISVDVAALRKQPGVVAVFTAADIPGENNCGPIIHDDPFLATDCVLFIGQPIAVVVADTVIAARAAAQKAVVVIEPLTAILTIEEAMAAQSFIMPAKGITRGNPAQALAAAPHRLQGTVRSGQQEQFYLEGQITYAVPREDDQLTLYVSTQHPDGNQREAAAALNLATKDVEVICRRMGGAFGGKEGNASIFSQSAALAAFKLKRPVKLRANRDDDMMITGKRHDFKTEYDVGFDASGRILGADFVLASRCGYSADFSGPVNDRAILHIDNCYYLPNLSIIGHRCKTHTQSATAFRGFGGPQGMIGIETVIEAIAKHLSLDPLAVRCANLYTPPSALDPQSMTTQYGQEIEDFIADKILDQLAVSSNYAERRAQLAAFNAASKYRKRGMALVPLKFGISFTATPLNQAGALVNIFQDGSVSVNHGGTEMGQGLNTKMAQVAADALGIGTQLVRVLATDTQKVPNASATAASSGSDLNGAAVRNACLQLRARLAAVAAARFSCAVDEVQFDGGIVSAGAQQMKWADLVKQTWVERVSLSCTGFYSTPEIKYDFATLQGRAFYYFCYGAAVSEVEIDTLTGEWWLKAVDILHDAGRSINPAIDMGQIEGAYIQGMGWLTMEECIWDTKGRLLTHGPSTYKIPVASDVPEHFKVAFFDGENIKPTPFKSKAVGEPPLMLALSAYYAIQEAVSAAAGGQFVPLDAPATPERILLAVERAKKAKALAA